MIGRWLASIFSSNPKISNDVFDMGNLSWRCHICKQNRPDEFISVFKHSHPSGLQENVRYCNDKLECIAGAKTFCFSNRPEEHIQELEGKNYDPYYKQRRKNG